ncbi:Ripening-related protein [Thalictrum thalictroides]|uniref:Ripening-related protein n=1 Tax=Thalictrum thalictroides TaxID=46969 RepID=A0A7J6WI29_THATH|nr:Ripening-related protein [Thalictrum thalictroides]
MVSTSRLCTILVVYVFLLALAIKIEARPSLTEYIPPPGKCNPNNDTKCCEEGTVYAVYTCSPTVSHSNKAVSTINSFEKEREDGAPFECDNSYDTPILAVSTTGWFNRLSRCHKNVTIIANGKKVNAMVVDEGDSRQVCDDSYEDYQSPCPGNIGDANKAVWKALGIKEADWKEMEFKWYDAK